MSWLFKNPVAIIKGIMPWLFKNSIVIVTWLNFDHTQWNIKKLPKNIKLPQTRFFLKKKLTKFLCISWSLLMCKINKKSENRSTVMRASYHFWAKITKLLWIIYFFFFRKVTNINPFLSSPLSLCKIVKQFFQWIQCCETRYVILIPKWVICRKQEIFGKVLTMTSIHY